MDSEYKTHLANVLISSYLAPTEDKFVQKNPPVKFERQQLPSAICANQKAICSKNMKKTASAEEEIGVFRAERYYGMKLEDDSTRVVEICGGNPAKKKEQRPDMQYRRHKSRSGTSSMTSESSWNSQAALFPSFLKNSSQNIQNKAKGRSLLVKLTCNRSCSDKKSILVHRNLYEQKGLQGGDVIRKEASRSEQIPVIMDGRIRFQTATLLKHKPKSSISGVSTREEELVFPISSSQLQNLAMTKNEDLRKSFEVFGSNKLDKKDLVAENLERKLSVLKWDAIPKAKATQTAPRSDQMFEDIGSDASSDLFEIENISGSNEKAFTRQTSGVISSSMTAYEPSEASIEWSAVTASAADFSSVAVYDEKKVIAKPKTTVDKGLQKSYPGGLLGCKSHKAVNIAETTFRNIDKLKSDSRPSQDWTKP